jgi:predicted permease
MNLLRRLCDVAFLRLRSLFGKTAVERELERELAFHLDNQIRENMSRGMSADEARRVAIRSLGGIAQVQEECRDMRRINQIETIWNDLRYAVRTLRRTPGFAVVLILTLALAIGANSAIFSVIYGVLLRPLPYANPDRLVRIYFNSDTQAKFPLNPYDLRDFRERNRTFESVAAISPYAAQLSGAGGDPIRLKSFAVTAGYFNLLGLSPELGREFTSEDELPERGRLAILSNHLWRNRFGSDRDIIGRSVTINALPYTVVGVMPANAKHPGNNFHPVADGDTVDLWLPFTFDGDPNYRNSHYLDGFGRLKPGVTPDQGSADLSAVLSQLATEHPGDYGWRVFLVPLYQETVGHSKRMLLVLLGAVALLLLIACVNAANLLLARSSARVREIAVRSALGAGRWRIVRQLLTESLVIALAGAALGTLLAVGGVRVLVSYLPAGFPRAGEIRLDSRVFAFTLIVAVVTGLFFGLVPAITAARTDLQQSLREGGRSASGGGGQLRLRNLLVVGETGLACVLLIAAGLMLHSFVNLLRADPGFRPQKVLTASVSLPSEHFSTEPQVIQFYERLTSNLESIPGVESAGIGSDLPWTGYDGNADGYTVEGRSAEYNSKTMARFHIASVDYFRALGIPLIRGRFFTGNDDTNSPTVIVVNKAMADRYWPDEDAIGKRISFHSQPATDKDWIQIVGVVGDIKDQPDGAATRPAFWLPHAQEPDRNVCLAVRTSLDPAQLTSQLRDTVRQLDSGLAIGDVLVMNQVVDAAFSSQRFALFLVALFAALALVLSTIGIYGVISYSVNQRMHEFGIRMALGARPLGLMRLIVGQGLRLSVVGAAVGLLCAAGLGRVLSSLLYGVSDKDPLTFAGVAALTLLTTTVACYLPARRASYADPTNTLRSE